MSKKSSKKKSNQGSITGTRLGALSLIISLVALGLSAYQFVTTPATENTTPTSEEPQFYILEHKDTIWIDKYTTLDYLDELNITYTTDIGSIVVLEFSCRIFIPATSSTTFTIKFNNNGTIPASEIYVSVDSYTTTTEYMKYTFEASTAGENYLVIYTSCDKEIDNYINDCLLTVTVYG